MAYLIPRGLFEKPTEMPSVPTQATESDWAEAKKAMGLRSTTTPSVTQTTPILQPGEIQRLPPQDPERSWSNEVSPTPEILEIVQKVKDSYLKLRKPTAGDPVDWKVQSYRVELTKQSDYLVKVITDASKNTIDILRIYHHLGRGAVTSWKANLPVETPLQVSSLKAPQELPPPYPETPSQPPPSATYITHKVTPQDTLASLSLFYSIPQDSIAMANNLVGQNVQERAVVYIPIEPGKPVPRGPPPSDQSQQRILLNQLCENLNKDGFSMDPIEARVYLETNDWDLVKAEAEARAGLEFEKSKPLPKGNFR